NDSIHWANEAASASAEVPMAAAAAARNRREARRVRSGFHGKLSVITRCLGSDSLDRLQLYIDFDRIYGGGRQGGGRGARGGRERGPPAGATAALAGPPEPDAAVTVGGTTTISVGSRASAIGTASVACSSSSAGAITGDAGPEPAEGLMLGVPSLCSSCPRP